MRKSFPVDQKEHGYHWLLSVLVERFGGRQASTTIHRYFEVNNFSFDESEHVKEYHLYHISSAFGAPFDPNSSLGEILDISYSGTITFNLANHVNISFDRKGIDAKEEWSEKGIADPISHMCELLLENMTKVPYVAARSASTSLGDIIRCIALLDTSHIITHLCHVISSLPKMTQPCITLQDANQIASLLHTNLTVPGDAYAYSNLEDKVLIRVGGIVMNGMRPVIAKEPNTITTLSGYVWDPG
ncbi:hypothetical protein HAX54_006660 [Datura stramonium]|uniref:Uncharacterized protein n=1 Tax=Datura stramonium TaxID=4076 RepID=A0ABS8TAL1_DATST|nr:hypothetical protein [Datura stramonium]